MIFVSCCSPLPRKYRSSEHLADWESTISSSYEVVDTPLDDDVIKENGSSDESDASREYEEADIVAKKRSSFRRLGSALHASFIRKKRSEESTYETLPESGWSRVSFKKSLKSRIKISPAPSPRPLKSSSPLTSTLRRSIPTPPPESGSASQSGSSPPAGSSPGDISSSPGNIFSSPGVYQNTIMMCSNTYQNTPSSSLITCARTTDSCSSGYQTIEDDVSVYSDYEVPDEVANYHRYSELFEGQSTPNTPPVIITPAPGTPPLITTPPPSRLPIIRTPPPNKPPQNRTPPPLSLPSTPLTRYRDTSDRSYDYIDAEDSESLRTERRGRSVSETLGTPPPVPDNQDESMDVLYETLPCMSLVASSKT